MGLKDEEAVLQEASLIIKMTVSMFLGLIFSVLVKVK